MAADAMKEQNSMKKFTAEVRSIWGDGKDPAFPFKVKGLLEKLLISANPQERWIVQLIKDGLPARELYRDKDHGFLLMGHVLDRDHNNSPHDHGDFWVLYGVYHGVAEITIYRRMDDGKVSGRVLLEKKGLHRLTPGMVMALFPGEAHSTFTVEPSVVFRFLSHELNEIGYC
ncbi:hypothetical protein EPO44_04675 [bacterium]|nr:MAG: hypothetical protein EPO44_04675 [bacterium]